jgi:hypothetical protein
MAAAVHHHLHLLLRPPPRQPGVFFTPRSVPPTRLRSSLRAPTCHLAIAPFEEADQREDKEEFVVVAFYKLVPVEEPRADVAAHLHFLQVNLFLRPPFSSVQQMLDPTLTHCIAIASPLLI